MRGLVVSLLVAGCSFMVMAGCGSESGAPVTPPGGAAVIEYQGTASVGDFITVTIDHDARTISYQNISNGTSGVAPYTVAPDGSYSISDPSGNLVSAWEVPGYALVFEANHTGPSGDTPSLVLAILKAPIAKSDLAGASYNYMQFRTSSGGMEIGGVGMDESSSIATNGYWPYGGANGMDSFHHGYFDGSLVQEDPTGNYLYGPDDGGNTYIFGTQGGFLAVDTPNGSIICLPQQPSKDFDPAWAGTYNAMLYQKTNAQTGVGNEETGDVSILRGTLEVGLAGQLTVTSSTGEAVVETELTPVADHPELVGPGKLENDCHGLFTFTVDQANSHEEIFVVFLDGALLVASYGYDLNAGDGSYHYFYGVGLKD